MTPMEHCAVCRIEVFEGQSVSTDVALCSDYCRGRHDASSGSLPEREVSWSWAPGGGSVLALPYVSGW